MARIVQRSAALSYSPLLALPAPRIAGLLPAPKPPSRLQPFVYCEPSLAALPDTLRSQFDSLPGGDEGIVRNRTGLARVVGRQSGRSGVDWPSPPTPC